MAGTDKPKLNKAAWNYHLVQIGEHIDAMERHAAVTTGRQHEALMTGLNRLRTRVADSKLDESIR